MSELRAPAPPTADDRRVSAPSLPAPRRLVGRELRRAVGGLLGGFLHAALLPLRRRALLRAVRADLEHVATPTEPGRPVLPDRPLRLFLSCAEASGEAHALRLADELERACREAGAHAPRLSGLGGARCATRGIELVGDPVQRAAMGLDAARSLSFYRGLLEDAAAHLVRERPDACVLVDSPALHVPLGHIARACGIRVVHYVTPQYWAWAPWRVKGYRDAVDLALTILPFEPQWFERHGVRTAHVGHPQMDQLEDVPRGSGSTAGGPLVLLPGSRRSIIERNLPWMIAVAARLRLEHPGLEVVLPHDREDLGDALRGPVAEASAAGWVRLATGDLHGELARARLALSVSGTVLLDLLHHRVPTAVIYRMPNAFQAWLGHHLLTVPWFASVNLLAGAEVLPEFPFCGEGPQEEVALRLSKWIDEGPERRDVLEGMERAARRLGGPGAARRAALHVLATAADPAPSPT